MRLELHLVTEGELRRWTFQSRSSMIALALLLCLVMLFAHAVWPTRYSYRDVRLGEATVTLRIDRLTNEAAHWRAQGWETGRR